MGFTPDEIVKDLDRKTLETLCMCLLYKRESDGLNGRTWDAPKHMVWEKRLSYILRRFNYLGHISPPANKNEQAVEADAESCAICEEPVYENDCLNCNREFD